jgi:hypothetical protein
MEMRKRRRRNKSTLSFGLAVSLRHLRSWCLVPEQKRSEQRYNDFYEAMA